MKQLFKSPILVIILSLALLGIGVQLFTSPGAFFTSILITIGIATLLILLVTRVIMPRMMGGQSGGAYQQAVKQSKRVHSPQQATAKKTTPVGKKNTVSFSKKKQEKKRHSSNRPLVRKPSDVKLTVIEGKKNKKKSRALF